MLKKTEFQKELSDDSTFIGADAPAAWANPDGSEMPESN